MSLLTLCLTLTLTATYISAASPIMIVPGLGGSQLEVKISNRSSCDTRGLWESYWINFLKPTDCVERVLMMEYDKETNTYSNSPGIEVRVPGFGRTETVEYLDTTRLIGSFNSFVDYFVDKGYTRGETIRGAPYDWRLAPDELQTSGYYRMVEELIEEMYSTSKEKVTIVAHSMGGPVTLYFLNKFVSQEWKDNYIHAFIPLSGAWVGGNGGLLTFVSEISLSHEPYSKFFTSSYQTMSSSVWLLPNPSAWKGTVLIKTATKDYSADDFKEMFSDIDRQEDYERFMLSLSINGDYPAPNVAVHCYYGVNTPTPEVFNYGSGFPDTFIDTTYGDGDGNINLQISEVCLRWSSQTAPFYYKTFSTGHVEMISDEEILGAILNTVLR